MKNIALIFTLLISQFLLSQNDSLFSKFNFEGDFRFRVEQDWNSKKSNGTYRTDRSRLRYRVRLGATYKHNSWASVGVRLRTGNPIKQQDPQLTLGDGAGEFGTLPIGFEKIYFQTKGKSTKIWLGKNSFPFKKQNELFWSDNVYPEGIFFQKSFINLKKYISKLDLNLGHFIINSKGSSFKNDSYLQGAQISATLNDYAQFFPGIYLFKNIPNIPDGSDTYLLDYRIINLGMSLKLDKASNTQVEFNYLLNLQDYKKNISIPENLKNQKKGWVIGLNYGKLINKKDWQFKASYSYLEKYAAVDFLAQNDWARWDYSSFESPDGRLTNFKGIELVAKYNVTKKMKLTLKYYKVAQLVSYNTHLENGNRIRIDLDIKL